MSNERLRAAMHQAGLEVDQLADAVEADVKTVRRWLGGRMPRGRYRTRLALALGTTEAELWPELDLRVDGRDEKSEILAAYAHANDLAAPDWRPLLQTATHRIDLLDSALDAILQSPGAAELLVEKASAGCQVRLLLSAPDSAYLTLADAEHDPELGMLDIPPSARGVERTLHWVESAIPAEGLQARTFVAASYNTILRFDDEMLITLHLYATPADRAPLLHVKRHSGHGLFERFAAHVDALWEDADPVEGRPSSG